MRRAEGRADGRFSLRQRLRSFRYAGSGIAFMLRTQHNAWIHLACTLAVGALGLALRISAADWRWLLVAMALVWLAELINTAIEFVCDLVSPGHDERVRRAKDLAAGAVLVCALTAAALGALTLWPRLSALAL
ncbi:diacylglycerol kinase family protein [Uliginosibacterium aquaticum]|uniref:Diacylglycerol kinase family protein n=1 Tax=Uliginosibacterium aquaticum TaxID=2731212 RepID=A0ABX2IGI9_9RHOO|nr:diacylglycerol kinase family protein [Uliginosibacterium aquaticum]NSL55891.1 diacylglycerol kinase family protein [Uliginosibacterium aquaticum]